jgi:hypothetical protein
VQKARINAEHYYSLCSCALRTRLISMACISSAAVGWCATTAASICSAITYAAPWWQPDNLQRQPTLLYFCALHVYFCPTDESHHSSAGWGHLCSHTATPGSGPPPDCECSKQGSHHPGHTQGLPQGWCCIAAAVLLTVLVVFLVIACRHHGAMEMLLAVVLLHLYRH